MPVGVERVDAQVLGPPDDAALAQGLHLLAVAGETHIRKSRHAPDGLLAFRRAAAEQEVSDALFRNDVGHVVAVDHDRRELHLQLLG